jgi:hypothetical protein
MSNSQADEPLFDAPLLERHLASMPPTYFADAPGALPAGPKMRNHAQYRSWARRPYGWSNIGPGIYRRQFSWRAFGRYDTLRVELRGTWFMQVWFIERVDSYWPHDFQVLVFGLGYAPIFAKSLREAMVLAEFYQDDHALQLTGCCWKHPCS